MKTQYPREITYESPKQKCQFPIPKANSPYSWAKTAEYVDNDKEKAIYYYGMAISEKDRVPSAVKDLAGLLHHVNKTAEACDLLKSYAKYFHPKDKGYSNLLNSIQKQLDSSGKSLRMVKITQLHAASDEEYIKSLFWDYSRIKSINISHENGCSSAFIYFFTNTAARKTLRHYSGPVLHKMFWVDEDKNVVKPVILGRRAPEFSLFTGRKGSEGDTEAFKGLYQYFPNQLSGDDGDYIENVLSSSILSYFEAE